MTEDRGRTLSHIYLNEFTAPKLTDAAPQPIVAPKNILEACHGLERHLCYRL